MSPRKASAKPSEPTEEPVAPGSPIVYRFTPPTPGEFYPGLPDRDLAEADVEDASVYLLSRAIGEGWYTAVPRESPGTGVPMEGIEVALGEEATITNDEPGLPEAPEIGGEG